VIFGNLLVRKRQTPEETQIVQEHPDRDRWVGPRGQGRRARYLFAKEIGAKITAVTVTEPFHVLSLAPSELEYTPIEFKKYAEAHAEKVLGTVSAAAKLAGFACETLHVEHDHIYEAIIDAASARRCNLIVMASHGRRGVSAVVLGSETVKVLTHSKIDWCIAEGIPRHYSVFLRHRRLGRRAQCLGVSPVLR
jgi:nucleotide-binding universal stress UspA family protein